MWTSSAERGKTVTVVDPVSARDQFIPAAFISKRKIMKAEHLDNARASTLVWFLAAAL